MDGCCQNPVALAERQKVREGGNASNAVLPMARSGYASNPAKLAARSCVGVCNRRYIRGRSLHLHDRDIAADQNRVLRSSS